MQRKSHPVLGGFSLAEALGLSASPANCLRFARRNYSAALPCREKHRTAVFFHAASSPTEYMQRKNHPILGGFFFGRGTRTLRFACELLALCAAQLLGGAPLPRKTPHRGVFHAASSPTEYMQRKNHPILGGLFFGRGTRTLRFACELLALCVAQLLGGAPLPRKTPHRGVFYAASSPTEYMQRKSHPILGGFFFGRGTRTRTQKNGFGDHYVTITSCPYLVSKRIIAKQESACQTKYASSEHDSTCLK